MKKVNISHTNSKLGAIPSVNIPAGKTCRADAPCQKGCYAKHGNWLFTNVKTSLENNLAIFNESPKDYFDSIIEQLNGLNMFRYFRWHSAGDIVNETYFEGVVRVAWSVPQTGFLLFTKKFSIVNNFVKQGNQIPSNLHIVYSAWDNTFKVDNPYNFPVTYVRFKDETKNADIPLLAIPCTGNCEKCLACWSLKEGQAVVFNKH